MAFTHLFTPGRIGTLSLKNRIFKAPTSTGMSNPDGSVTERLIRHYREAAAGGVAMVIAEYAYIDNIASKSAHCQLGISCDDHVSGLAWLVEVIKEQGARAAIQLEHCGRQKFLGTPPIKAASAVPWAALEARCGKSAVPEVLTEDEIWQIIDAFGDGVRRATFAGFDLVEIHGAHGYLLTNFLSPHTNKREDQWGGSLHNRMRLLTEIVKNARSKVGRDFPLTVRLSGTDYEPDGFPIDETVEVAKVLEGLGIDAIHVSGGDHHQMIHQVSPMAIPRCHNVWAAEAIKKAVKIPVIASGSITLPELGEQVLVEGKGDFISLARPLWADPEWPRKAQEGRPEDIRPCIRCNDGCLDRTFFRFRAIGCSVNPRIGREGELEITPATRRKKVAVIGGGPAGMEAARVCSLRGHKVTLFEKRALGGVGIEGSVADFKSDLRFLVEQMANQIRRMNIRVVEAEAGEDFAADGFDTVILATGGVSAMPDIPGVEHAVDALAVFREDVQKIGRQVVVMGGGETAVEAAIYLDELGRDVTLVHRREALMTKDCVVTDRIAYLERLATTRIATVLSHQVVEIRNDGVTAVDGTGRSRRIDADTVVAALGYVGRRDGFAERLKTREGLEVFEIGDLVKTGKIYDAIHTGYKTALRV